MAEKGIPDLETAIHDILPRQSIWPPKEGAALSPTGSLPILIEVDGTTVTQSLAILEYLEDKQLTPPMWGGNARERARIGELVKVFDEALDAFALWARYGSDPGGYVRQKYREVIKIGAEGFFQKVRLAEVMNPASEFLVGDHPTSVDCVAMALLHYTGSVAQIV